MKEQCKAPIAFKSIVWMQGMFMSTLINAAFKILSIISLLKNQIDINLMRASPCAFYIVNKNWLHMVLKVCHIQILIIQD